jgi:hypothetical protein
MNVGPEPMAPTPIANEVMPIEHRASSRERGDEGGAMIKVIASVAAVGLAAGGLAYMGEGWIRSKIPGLPNIDIPFVPEEGLRGNNVHEAVRPVAFDCRSLNVYDASGATATTRIDGVYHTFKVEKAKAIQSTCFDNAKGGTQIKPGKTPDGEPKVDVYVDISKMRFMTYLDPADLEVKSERSGLSGVVQGGADVSGGLGDTACRVITLGHCDKNPLNAGTYLRKKFEKDNAVAQADLLAELARSSRTQCAAKEWGLEKRVIERSYDDQAEEVGIRPENTNVHYVDQYGRNADSKTPNFELTTQDELAQEGIVADPNRKTRFSGKIKIRCVTNQALLDQLMPATPADD